MRNGEIPIYSTVVASAASKATASVAASAAATEAVDSEGSEQNPTPPTRRRRRRESSLAGQNSSSSLTCQGLPGYSFHILICMIRVVSKCTAWQKRKSYMTPISSGA